MTTAEGRGAPDRDEAARAARRLLKQRRREAAARLKRQRAVARAKGYRIGLTPQGGVVLTQRGTFHRTEFVSLAAAESWLQS